MDPLGKRLTTNCKIRAKNFEGRMNPRDPNRAMYVNGTWTPKVCRIIAFLAVLGVLGPLFYILLGFGYRLLGYVGVIVHWDP